MYVVVYCHDDAGGRVDNWRPKTSYISSVHGAFFAFSFVKKGGRLEGTLQQSKLQSGKPVFRSQQGPFPFPLQKSNFEILPGRGSEGEGGGEGTNFA